MARRAPASRDRARMRSRISSTLSAITIALRRQPPLASSGRPGPSATLPGSTKGGLDQGQARPRGRGLPQSGWRYSPASRFTGTASPDRAYPRRRRAGGIGTAATALSGNWPATEVPAMFPALAAGLRTIKNGDARRQPEKRLDRPSDSPYQDRDGEVAEWSKALPC